MVNNMYSQAREQFTYGSKEDPVYIVGGSRADMLYAFNGGYGQRGNYRPSISYESNFINGDYII